MHTFRTQDTEVTRKIHAKEACVESSSMRFSMSILGEEMCIRNTFINF